MVRDHCGVNTNRCFHCRFCSGGCPFTGAMDNRPNEVIHMRPFGLIGEGCTVPNPIPIMHFSDLLAMAADDLPSDGWFYRQL